MSLLEAIGLFANPDGLEGNDRAEVFAALVQAAQLLVDGDVVVTFADWATWSMLEREALAVACSRRDVESHDARLQRGWGPEGVLRSRLLEAHRKVTRGT